MDEKILSHDTVLRERVFQTETKWPQFNLLLDDVASLMNLTPQKSTIVSFERGKLYGGFSLLAPYFSNAKFISVDCSPVSADDRGAYNESMIDDSRFIQKKSDFVTNIHEIQLENDVADLVLIPNLVHHIEDQDTLFDEAIRILKPGGQLYIFEALVREIHQAPDDFLRYTPYGLSAKLLHKGMSIVESKETGNVFSAIAYCWVQALEYFPESDRKSMEEWFFKEHFPKLMIWDSEFKTNNVRKYTRFPTAFSILSAKNVAE